MKVCEGEKYDKNWYKQNENVGMGNLKPILDIPLSFFFFKIFSPLKI
jgi:hypothetical protein